MRHQWAFIPSPTEVGVIHQFVHLTGVSLPCAPDKPFSSITSDEYSPSGKAWCATKVGVYS